MSRIAFAQADVGEAEPADYYPRIEQAIHAYDQGHWPEAYASFQQAHALSPNARTLRGLALTAFRLRRYAESERHCEAALASEVKPLTEAQRTELVQLLDWARRYVDRIELKLQPPSARALIDGIEVDGTSLALDVGEHVLSVQATGYVSQQQRLVAVGGRQAQVHVSLPAIEVRVERARTLPAPPPPAQSPSLLASPWLWTAVGVVAGGAVVFALTRDGDARQQPAFTAGAAVLTGPGGP